ncbi:MAG: PDZ domain-containing protein [Euryarchaeota archaeon]|nr:PDZ domain-containing protein [Euryarchaeota archaeon]
MDRRSYIACIASGVIGALLMYMLIYPPWATQSRTIVTGEGTLNLQGVKSVEVVVLNGSIDVEEVVRRVYQDAVESVVRVEVERNITGEEEHPAVEATGSGIVYRSDGYILTADHVVVNASSIVVVLHDGSSYAAELVGRDPMTDIAVLRIRANNLKPALLGNSSQVEPGSIAIAIGNPYGLANSVSYGIVSGVNRSIEIGTGYRMHDIIQTDTAINPGNSGGPLLNSKGEVIGVNTAIFSTSTGFQGIGFAIPINTARYVADSIIKHGKVLRAWLGITGIDLTPALARALNLSVSRGALVMSVAPESPAEEAGVLPSRGVLGSANFTPGDVILEVGGRKVENMDDVVQAVTSHRIGETIELKLYRNGRVLSLRVTLGERPANL